MNILKSKTKEVISEIDSFLDTIAKSALVFKAGVNDYFDKKMDRLAVRLTEVDHLENEADSLRRSIKYKLYSRMLIPDARGDVLGFLETSDNVIDRTKKILKSFEIEKPDIPGFLTDDFKDLSTASAQAVDEMIKAARAFFSNTEMINDFINKVYFYEHEADKLEEQIKRKVFASPKIVDLCYKVYIRDFAERISHLSDDAENVCERLFIYAIKRSI
jgi:predicted phosphate transport protein (TIGR00153 family)